MPHVTRFAMRLNTSKGVTATPAQQTDTEHANRLSSTQPIIDDGIWFEFLRSPVFDPRIRTSKSTRHGRGRRHPRPLTRRDWSARHQSSRIGANRYPSSKRSTPNPLPTATAVRKNVSDELRFRRRNRYPSTCPRSSAEAWGACDHCCSSIGADANRPTAGVGVGLSSCDRNRRDNCGQWSYNSLGG